MNHLLALVLGLQPAWAGDILVARKPGPEFALVSETLQRQVPRRRFQEYLIDPTVTFENFRARLEQDPPRLVVLMDNEAVQWALRYNAERPSASSPAPAGKLRGLALMAINLKSILQGNSEIAGITFEPPGYSVVTQFRFVTSKPIRNVLVFYRPSFFARDIEEASEQLRAEGIALHAVSVEQQGLGGIEAFVQANLPRYLAQPDKYDALWVLLDSTLLTPTLLRTAWLPGAKASRIPFITGAASLVQTDLDFAAFAVTPDLHDLASQAAQQLDASGVESVLSVRKILNRRKAAALGLPLREDHLEGVEVLTDK